MRIGVDIIRQVTSPDHDWTVLYFGNRKIWEGGDWNDEAFEAISTALGARFYSYEFTEWEDIGETPVSFMHIESLKEIKDE